MIRALHRWPGLLALALVTILALSGAALSVFPAAERLAAPQAETGLTVAALAGVAGCSSATATEPRDAIVLEGPPPFEVRPRTSWPTAGWPEATPEEVGD